MKAPFRHYKPVVLKKVGSFELVKTNRFSVIIRVTNHVIESPVTITIYSASGGNSIRGAERVFDHVTAAWEEALRWN